MDLDLIPIQRDSLSRRGKSTQPRSLAPWGASPALPCPRLNDERAACVRAIRFAVHRRFGRTGRESSVRVARWAGRPLGRPAGRAWRGWLRGWAALAAAVLAGPWETLGQAAGEGGGGGKGPVRAPCGRVGAFGLQHHVKAVTAPCRPASPSALRPPAQLPPPRLLPRSGPAPPPPLHLKTPFSTRIASFDQNAHKNVPPERHRGNTKSCESGMARGGIPRGCLLDRTRCCAILIVMSVCRQAS